MTSSGLPYGLLKCDKCTCPAFQITMSTLHTPLAWHTFKLSFLQQLEYKWEQPCCHTTLQRLTRRHSMTHTQPDMQTQLTQIRKHTYPMWLMVMPVIQIKVTTASQGHTNGRVSSPTQYDPCLLTQMLAKLLPNTSTLS